MKTPFHPPNDHANAEIVSPGHDRSPASPWLSVVVNGIWAIAGAASVVGFMAVRSIPIAIPTSNHPVAQNAVAATIVPSSSAPALAAIPSSGGNQNFITDVVNRVGPAVVRIDASRTVKTSVPEAFQDPFFRQFFGSDLPMQPNQRVERGLGSGFIINTDGRILTNAHVVDGADRVKVTLKDGRSFEGKVLGADPVTDVAVVEIQASNLPSVKLANSDRLQPGEWTIAIGNPLGLDSTVTVGILSATGRSSSQVGVPDKRVSFLQTDAAINPGNSGGPLLNQQGEVIGVNTAIIGNAQGLGFAIPINTVTRIADRLARDGKVAHPFLGIQMVTLSPEIRDNINQSETLPQPLRQDKGVLVAKVLPNSPAARAGLKEGDVIQKVAGQPVSQAEAVQRSVEAAAIGESLALEVDRNDRTLTIQVKPGELPTSR